MISEPIISVTCDECGDEEEFQLTCLARGNWDEKELHDQIKSFGWVIRDDNHFCSQECHDNYYKGD